MPTEAELRSQISQLQQSYENAKANNTRLFDRIKQLEEAKGYVDAAKGYAKDFKGAVKKIDIDDRWAGKRRNGADNGIECITDKADTFVDGLGDLGWALFCEIADLYTQVDYFTLVISKAEEGISNLTKSIQELTDGD